MADPQRKIRVGRKGEDLSVQFLLERGVRIVGRNYRTRHGEIDIIGMVGEDLVFFEVRTRTSDLMGFPEDSINARKRQHMVAAAAAYMQMHPGFKADWRIDVLAVQLRPGGEAQIEWFENAA